jgi:hypothetical protein
MWQTIGHLRHDEQRDEPQLSAGLLGVVISIAPTRLSAALVGFHRIPQPINARLHL